MANTKGILERLKQGPVLCAEGYLFELERRGYVKAGDRKSTRLNSSHYS